MLYLRRFNIPVDDIVLMDKLEGAEKRGEVVPHISDEERTILKSEICVREVRQDCNNLVEMSKRGDQGTDRAASSQVI